MNQNRQANFHNLLMQTTNAGTQSFSIRGKEVKHACPDCRATYPQTDAGWESLSEHKMEHGRPNTYDATELAGKTLDIFVVETDDTGYGGKEKSAFDIYGQDEKGIVYHLSSFNGWQKGSWKWKRQQSPLKNLPMIMPSGQGSPSNGSKNTGER